MKILVCGAFSTGKTQLVSKLELALEGRLSSMVLSDVARLCPLPLNKNQNIQTTLWLTSEQIRSEVEASSRIGTIAICDRGVPDILSHHSLARPNYDRVEYLEEFEAFARSWVKTYDHIFVTAIDPNIPIKSDGLRAPDASYRKALEQEILKVLADTAKSFQVLPHDEDERAQTILRTLS